MVSTNECEEVLSAVRALGGATDQATVTRIVRRAARALTSADGATFVLREGELVHYVDEDAISPLWKGRRFRAAQCISGWAMIHREAVAIEDVFADPRIPPDAYEPTFVKSLAMVPIRKEDPIGAIGAYWANRHRPSERQLELLEILADATASAFERAEMLASERAARRHAERALRDGEEMLRVVTHDVRNPLNTIAMAATILGQTNEVSALADRVRKHSATIKRAAWRLERLISDLADSAAIEAGVFSLRDGRCTVAGILEPIRDLEELALDHGHVLSVEMPAFEATLSCAEDRMVQAIGNLVRNAVTHTPEGTMIRVGCALDHGNVRFFVEDDGPGIAPETFPTLFTRYARGSSRTGGTGLGLFIVKGIVEAHGGAVDVTSNALGTRFSLFFPRASEQDQCG